MIIYCICTQYLVGAPFALITASVRRGMEVISLWHCWGGVKPRFLSQWPSAHLQFLVSCFSSSSWQYSIFSMFRSGEFAGQSSTTTPWSFNQLLVLLAVWAGAKSCWKMIFAYLKSWSAEGSMKCSTMVLKKHNGATPADDIAPQSSQTVET